MSILSTIRNVFAQLTGSLIGGSRPAMILDISHYQGDIDPALWGDWVEFVIVKFLERFTPDASAHPHARLLLQKYRRIGAYLFLKAGAGAAQAECFWNMVREYAEAGQIGLLVIDWERHPDGTWPSLQDVKDCYYRLRQLTGVEVAIYTRKTFVDAIPGGAAWLAAEQMPLMIAHYLTLSVQDLAWSAAYDLLLKNRFAPWVPADGKAVIHQITGDRLGCPGVWDDSTRARLSRLDLSFAWPEDAARWSAASLPAPSPVPEPKKIWQFFFPLIRK